MRNASWQAEALMAVLTGGYRSFWCASGAMLGDGTALPLEVRVQWTTIVATVVGAVLGVGSTLVADHLKWRREVTERDRDALRTSFMEYLAALAQARDAFTRAEPDQERVGKGHIAIGEHGVYAVQQQMQLIAQQTIIDLAGQATLTVLDFHDAVVAGHDVDSAEYIQAWQAARETRCRLVEAMQTALQRS